MSYPSREKVKRCRILHSLIDLHSHHYCCWFKVVEIEVNETHEVENELQERRERNSFVCLELCEWIWKLILAVNAYKHPNCMTRYHYAFVIRV